jgi:subtilisin-like proprotein convertase family protein
MNKMLRSRVSMMNKMLRSSLGLVMAFVAGCASDGPADDTTVQVIKPDVQDVSLPLSELAKVPVSEVSRTHEAEPVRPIPHMRTQSAAQQPDPVVQNAIGGANIPSTITTFEGMGVGLAGFTVQAAPPDTDGDVGPNHYVQIVNLGVTIFSKTGAKLLGPIGTNTLFNGFPGACATTNDGDGTVRYDRIANRWVIAQFSVNGGNGPFFQCVAVSTGPDPTGTYNRYQFTFDGFNDYPKMGLWPDGYYFTFNMFPNNQFAGSRACAFDRVKMLAGLAATEQCFDTGPAFGGLLASDLDGPTLPPAGEPNFLVALDTTALDFWKFHVDFATPANSTFVGPTMIPVAAYTPLCNGGTCVRQPGTNQRLDSLADRLMNRLVYRRFSNHEALLVSHAVAAGTGGGVRFYELRSPATTPTMFQQGTYAPDTSFRWMSSMAFDSAGNMGMGFSIASSSPAINPSIHYTGRLTADALGTMGQGEATLVAGTGSQTGNNLSRWGDYSSMNIDPSDDCTFWFTSEYMGASGSFNWHTRIGSFKFANCGTPANDFSITVNPTSRTVAAGASTTYAISTAVLSGAAQTINLTVSGLPAGVTGTFNPVSVTAGGSSTLTLTAAPTAASSTTQFTITGTGTAATHTVNASVTVIGNVAPTVAITAPTNGSTVSGTAVPVAATATDADGTVASVRFDLPDGTSVTDTTSPFSTTFDSTKVVNGSGYVIKATATDNLGATGVSTVTFTVINCLNNTFTATGVPTAIPDNDPIGITSSIPVTGNGTVASLSLSLNITHPFRGDLSVTLISPAGTQFNVSNRLGGSDDNVIFTNLAVPTFNGQTAAGTWKLKVQDLAPGDVGTLTSWSMTIVGRCTPTTSWSGSATPNLPTIDNGTACTSLTVATTGGDASLAKLDISGRHDFRSILRGTLGHNGLTVEAFPTGTFPTGSGTFSFTSRAVPGLAGDSSGTWTFCIIDTDALGDTGVLNTWSVHD